MEDQLSRVYANAAPWHEQMQVPSALALDNMPRIFRGCTLRDFGAAHPSAAQPTNPWAKYCGACSSLVVNIARHEASWLHRDRVKARREVGFPHQYAAELRVQIERDPVFAALVLGP